jgi:hypothetical protein
MKGATGGITASLDPDKLRRFRRLAFSNYAF